MRIYIYIIFIFHFSYNLFINFLCISSSVCVLWCSKQICKYFSSNKKKRNDKSWHTHLRDWKFYFAIYHQTWIYLKYLNNIFFIIIFFLIMFSRNLPDIWFHAFIQNVSFASNFHREKYAIFLQTKTYVYTRCDN